MSGPSVVWAEVPQAEDRPWIRAIANVPVPPETAAHARVARDDSVWGGRTIIAGTRIPVFLIADLEAEGESVPDIRERYPHLTSADVYAALAYSAEFAVEIQRERDEYERALQTLLKQK